MRHCPECGTKMRYAIDTPYAMRRARFNEKGLVKEDNTNMYEYWQCPKCFYYVSFTGNKGEEI
ncbi:unnamed protein product [marine sediment metagenome]|uniref:Uncharacterized protein n=1 Tax=marine sediment metagenome TaxID=412755 RepID=X1SJK1_9ZZZZ